MSIFNHASERGQSRSEIFGILHFYICLIFELDNLSLCSAEKTTRYSANRARRLSCAVFTKVNIPAELYKMISEIPTPRC